MPNQIDKSTTISIGLAVILIAGLIYNEVSKSSLKGELELLKSKLETHIEDPTLHYNIVRTMKEDYVTRYEYDARLNYVEDSIDRIDERTEKILEILSN